MQVLRKLRKRVRAFWGECQDLKKWDYPPDLTFGHPLIVSLTTVPSRIAHIQPTILSLLKQTRRPTQIEINLGLPAPMGHPAWEIPTWLSELQSVKLFWITPDLGPATKWIPTIKRYQDQDQNQDQDPLIVIVDDDMIYPRNLIESLVKADRESSADAVFCVNGHPLSSNLVFFDHPSDRAIAQGKRRVAIVEGCGGYTLRPRHFGVDLTTLTEMTGVPEGALRNDDIWVSGLLSRQNVQKYQIPVGKRYSLPQAEVPAIQGPRAAQSDALLKYFEKDWHADEMVR